MFLGNFWALFLKTAQKATKNAITFFPEIGLSYRFHNETANIFTHFGKVEKKYKQMFIFSLIMRLSKFSTQIPPS